jgi:predicted nucleic acid-binding protein
MNAVVVDTDVVSLVFKGDSRAEKYLSALTAPDLLVSFMTEAELERWILQAKWGPERIVRFRTYMKRFVSVPSSRDLIVKWAEVMVVARSLGRRIEVAVAGVTRRASIVFCGQPWRVTAPAPGRVPHQRRRRTAGHAVN